MVWLFCHQSFPYKIIGFIDKWFGIAAHPHGHSVCHFCWSLVVYAYPRSIPSCPERDAFPRGGRIGYISIGSEPLNLGGLLGGHCFCFMHSLSECVCCLNVITRTSKFNRQLKRSLITCGFWGTPPVGARKPTSTSFLLLQLGWGCSDFAYSWAPFHLIIFISRIALPPHVPCIMIAVFGHKFVIISLAVLSTSSLFLLLSLWPRVMFRARDRSKRRGHWESPTNSSDVAAVQTFAEMRVSMPPCSGRGLVCQKVCLKVCQYNLGPMNC